MNIALFASAFYPHVGGVEELCRQLAHAYRAAGHGCIVLTNRWPRSLPEVEEYEGIAVYRLAMRVPEGSLKARVNYRLTHEAIRRGMLGILTRHETGVLHVQCVSSNGYYALLAKRELGLPLVVSAQGERTMDAGRLYEKSAFANRVLRELLDEADHVTACSKDTLNDLAKWYEGGRGRGGGTGAIDEPEADRRDSKRSVLSVSGGQKRSSSSRGETARGGGRRDGIGPLGERAGVVYNGIQLADFEGVEAHQHPRPFVLGIGRLVPQKGFDVLIRAFAKADAASHDLIIAGDGPERAALMAQAWAAGLEGRVHFAGRADRETAVALFKGCSFFVLPSRMEPMGIVNLEAMAAGKAVIASDVGGVPEIVENRQTGLLVPPEDAAALAGAMAKLAGDVPLRERLGAAGRERAEGFGWDRIAGQYLGIYRALLDPAGGGTSEALARIAAEARGA